MPGWEDAVKTAVTDALKRCAADFGIGRELYNEPVEGAKGSLMGEKPDPQVDHQTGEIAMHAPGDTKAQLKAEEYGHERAAKPVANSPATAGEDPTRDYDRVLDYAKTCAPKHFVEVRARARTKWGIESFECHSITKVLDERHAKLNPPTGAKA